MADRLTEIEAHVCGWDCERVCGYEAGRAFARVRELETALERLGSAEGFEGAGIADRASFAGRELQARIRYARAALAPAEERADGREDER